MVQQIDSTHLDFETPNQSDEDGEKNVKMRHKR